MTDKWDNFFNEVLIRKDSKGGKDFYRTMPFRFVYADDRFLVRYFTEFEDTFLIATNDSNFKKHEFMPLRQAIFEAEPIFKTITLSESDKIPEEVRMQDQDIDILCKLPNDTYAVRFYDNDIYGDGISLVECSDVHNKMNKIIEKGDIERIEPQEIYKQIVRGDNNLMVYMNPRQIIKELRNFSIGVITLIKDSKDLDLSDEQLSRRERANEKYFYTITAFQMSKYLKTKDMKNTNSSSENKLETNQSGQKKSDENNRLK